MDEGLPESKFYMWRTLFAVAHADNILTDEEVRFMSEALTDLSLSPAQRETLMQDIYQPKDIVEMFENISEAQDQAKFFAFARKLVWVDGDYGPEEQEIMLKLKEIHLKNFDLEDIMDEVELELDEEEQELFIDISRKVPQERARGLFSLFHKLFS